MTGCISMQATPAINRAARTYRLASHNAYHNAADDEDIAGGAFGMAHRRVASVARRLGGVCPHRRSVSSQIMFRAALLNKRQRRRSAQLASNGRISRPRPPSFRRFSPEAAPDLEDKHTITIDHRRAISYAADDVRPHSRQSSALGAAVWHRPCIIAKMPRAGARRQKRITGGASPLR